MSVNDEVKSMDNLEIRPVLTSELLVSLEERGLVHSITKPEILDQLLNSKRLTAYAGFDCTAGSLHIGNLVSLVLLKHFQQHGHNIVAVVGTGTSLIGDPSGKKSARPVISEEEIGDNAVGIEANIRAVLGSGAHILHNKGWLQGLTLLNFLRDVGRHIPMSKMLNLDSVKSRLSQEDGMSFLEFNYSLLQAFDFKHLTQEFGLTVQLGGSDQWGNITMGCELIRKTLGKEAFGLTTPLLTNAAGEKMGKSVSGAIWLSAEKLAPWDFWQFWRNVDDRDTLKLLKLFDMDHTVAHLEAMAAELDPNQLKVLLATSVTSLVHGKEVGEAMKLRADAIFNQNVLEGLPQLNFREGEALTAIMQRTGRAQTISAARRLIEGKGVKLNGEVVANVHLVANPDWVGAVLEIGKKNKFELAAQ